MELPIDAALCSGHLEKSPSLGPNLMAKEGLDEEASAL
jgi:hypothetical protein